MRSLNAILALFFLGLSSSRASAATWTSAYRLASILSNGEGSALSNVVPKTTLAAPAPTPIPMPAQSSNGAPVPDVTRFSGIDGSLINIDNHAFEVQTLQPYSLQNPDPQTLRFELRSGDVYGNYSGTERVELEQQIYVNRTWGYPADSDLHVAYDFMLEPGNPNTSQWVVIGQWHHGDSGSPPFAVALRGEYMQIITRTADTNAEVNMYTDPKPIQRGHYYSMDIWVNFARGTLSVVRDGVPIVSFSGQGKLGTGNSRYYWKHGLYRAPTKNDTQVAHYRNFVISP
jgi:Polysaccharide lyase